MMKKLIPIFILFLLLCISSVYAATNISSCPYNITISGKYELNQSINSNGTCIQLKANNLEIDCKGFSITGNNSGAGIYNWRSRTNVTFKNCKIHNFTYGIQFTSSPSSIDYDTISDITYDNLTIDTPTAIYIGEDGDTINNITVINSDLNASAGTGFTSRAGNGGRRFRILL